MPNAPASRARWRRPALAALALAAVVAVGAWAWNQRGAGNAAGAGFRTATVERGDIRVSISSTGALSAISTVVVGSEISGRVTEVLVDFNDRVRRGQVLARLDPSTFEAQIAQGNAAINSARANAAQAEAALRNAQADYSRKAELGRQQLIARSEVDLARAALEQARAQLDASRAQIAQQQAGTRTTRLNLGRTEIRSPVDGVVLTRTIEPGQTVAASLQAPELFKLAEDLSKMKIELAVDEADIGQVKVGQAVSFTVDAFADRQFRGQVQQVRLSATTTSNVVTYPVVVSVDNSDGTLLPGLTVNAEIEVSKRDDILKVSNAALRYKPTGEAATATAAAQAPQGGQNRGGGIGDDLARVAGSLQLKPDQQAAFDAALTALRERQAARMAQAQQRGASMFGGAPRPGGNAGGGSGAMQAQMRQRMAERMQQDFAPFRATLDDTQKQRWDAELRALLGAKRAPIYTLVDGKPEMVQVRIGASDGTSTEVSGAVKEGDVVVVGERAKE